MQIVSMLKSLVIVPVLLLTACGGGSGGGGGTGTSVSSAYTGATTQATLTSSNAAALSVDAFEGGQAGATMSLSGVTQERANTAVPENPRIQALAGTLEESVMRVLSDKASGAPTIAGVTQQYTLPGPDGGSLTYTINVNESTYAFSGTITYNDYKVCQNGPTISGTVTFSGTLSQSQFTSFTISFSALSFTEEGVVCTTTGTVTLNQSEEADVTTVSVVNRNSSTGKTFWVKDYVYTLSTSGTLSISGTYYDPTYGYVSLSTQTPLEVSSIAAWPTAGVLIFSGSNGSKARLTFTTYGYVVEVDANGNGVYTVVD